MPDGRLLPCKHLWEFWDSPVDQGSACALNHLHIARAGLKQLPVESRLVSRSSERGYERWS